LTVGESTAAMFRAAGGVFRSILKCHETPVRALNLKHDGTHVWQEGISFFYSKQFHREKLRRDILLVGCG
jgi:hypothetical protein